MSLSNRNLFSHVPDQKASAEEKRIKQQIALIESCVKGKIEYQSPSVSIESWVPSSDGGLVCSVSVRETVDLSTVDSSTAIAYLSPDNKFYIFSRRKDAHCFEIKGDHVVQWGHFTPMINCVNLKTQTERQLKLDRSGFLFIYPLQDENYFLCQHSKGQQVELLNVSTQKKSADLPMESFYCGRTIVTSDTNVCMMSSSILGRQRENDANQLLVFDLTNKQDAKLIKKIPLPEECRCLEFTSNEDFLILGFNGFFKLYDVSDKLNPKEILVNYLLQSGKMYQKNYRIGDLIAYPDKKHLVISAEYYGAGPSYDGRVELWNIEDIRNPTFVGQVKIDYARIYLTSGGGLMTARQGFVDFPALRDACNKLNMTQAKQNSVMKPFV